jgi:hypothetical protein
MPNGVVQAELVGAAREPPVRYAPRKGVLPCQWKSVFGYIRALARPKAMHNVQTNCALAH